MPVQNSNRRPLEGAYIAQARRAAVAQRLKEQAAADEAEAKRETAKLMHTNRIEKFNFKDDKGVEYRAKLVRPKSRQVSVKHFYTMLANGEISLTDFLEAVTVDVDKARELLDDRLESVMETVKGPLTLRIAPFNPHRG